MDNYNYNEYQGMQLGWKYLLLLPMAVGVIFLVACLSCGEQWMESIRKFWRNCFGGRMSGEERGAVLPGGIKGMTRQPGVPLIPPPPPPWIRRGTSCVVARHLQSKLDALLEEVEEEERQEESRLDGDKGEASKPRSPPPGRAQGRISRSEAWRREVWLSELREETEDEESQRQEENIGAIGPDTDIEKGTTTMTTETKVPSSSVYSVEMEDKPIRKKAYKETRV